MKSVDTPILFSQIARMLAILGLAVFSLSANAQVQDAIESSPGNHAWMRGFPPHPDSTISAIDGSFFRFPALRYSVCHMREFFPTVNVPCAQVDRYRFDVEHDYNIDDIRFLPSEQADSITWRESLDLNYVDGIIVLHKGTIVYEEYFGELDPSGIHAAMSVSKTFTGTLGAMLVAEGLLDENRTCASYIPELENSGFGSATVRQVLDMTTSILYSENYADPEAEIWDFSLAGNPFPKPAGYEGPRNYYEYLATVQQDGEHGEEFGYKTVNTDLMGWLISRALYQPLAQVLSDRIWKPMGANFDAYYQIDGSGIAFAGGGLNANARDLAMFGEMIRNNGLFNNRQIVPSEVVHDIMAGGDQEAFAKSVYKKHPGWSYRNMWWNTHNEHGAFAARGVHGQTIYIDPTAEMVIVRLASHPVASNSANDGTSLPAYQALAEYLLEKDRD